MISIIIPTLDEAGHLPVTLKKIRANSAAHEIIIADGGSHDATLQIAIAAGANIVTSDKSGRSLQMNAGAKTASGDIFLFLHGDTHLHDFSLEQIAGALKNERVVGGGFARRFDSDSLFLRCTCAVATLRCSLFGLFLGDQGIFVRRNVFEKLGGFREMKLFEDVDFSRRLAQAGKTVTLRPAVISSARRFAGRGPVLMTCRDLWLTCKYVSGLENYSAR
ncbi:MAG: TIGR04283 family arsenosugar biosynthesis glycosyltransferase [Verrucomicrobiota bacterium]